MSYLDDLRSLVLTIFRLSKLPDEELPEKDDAAELHTWWTTWLGQHPEFDTLYKDADKVEYQQWGGYKALADNLCAAADLE